MPAAKSIVVERLLIMAGIMAAFALSATAQDSTDSRGGALQLLRRARVAMQTGDTENAEKLIQSALDYSAQAKDSLVEGWGQQLAGEMAFAAGDAATATKAFSAALSAFTRAKDAAGAAGSRVNLGRLLLAAGKPREAVAH